MSNPVWLSPSKLSIATFFFIFCCLFVWFYAEAYLTHSLWAVIRQNISSNDGPIYSGHNRDQEHKAQKIINQQKVVLLWTDFFGLHWRDHISDWGGNTLPGSDDPNENLTCLMITDRRRLNESDALIFHGRDFNFADLPSHRLFNQRWVFYLLESPIHSGFGNAAWERANKLQFNWTMTYNRKAIVWEPYWHISPWKPNQTEIKEVEERAKRFVESFPKRPEDGVWFVSNCGAPSRRNLLVEKLKELGVKIDTFGQCSGKDGDAEIKTIGVEAFFSRYRFYMSLENSLCEDYATEKFGNALNFSRLYGLIPVAYGGVNYSDIAPPDSSVVVESFTSVNELAEHLKMLRTSANTEAVGKYFEWHKTHKLCDEPYKRFGFRNLCQKLFDEEKKCDNAVIDDHDSKLCSHRNPVDDIRQLLGSCRLPNFL